MISELNPRVDQAEPRSRHHARTANKAGPTHAATPSPAPARARPAATSARSSSWPTTPKTCKFARAGRRQPQIGLVARPASQLSREEGHAPSFARKARLGHTTWALPRAYAQRRQPSTSTSPAALIPRVNASATRGSGRQLVAAAPSPLGPRRPFFCFERSNRRSGTALRSRRSRRHARGFVDAEVWLGAGEAADSPRSAALPTLLQIDQSGCLGSSMRWWGTWAPLPGFGAAVAAARERHLSSESTSAWVADHGEMGLNGGRGGRAPLTVRGRAVGPCGAGVLVAAPPWSAYDRGPPRTRP